MTIDDFKSALLCSPGAPLVFVLPDGSPIPERYHVTEVGHVAKRFIDCGGTVRRRDTVQLQLWLGSDSDHRLVAGKLARIIDVAGDIIPDGKIDVEVEYERESISQYQISSVSRTGSAVYVTLAGKHTDCLAKEACGCAPSQPSAPAACGCAPGTCCA